MHRLSLALLPVLLSIGCAASVGKLQTTQSSMHLDRANFRVIKASARGVDQGFNLFGFIPIIMPSISDATDNLMQGIDAEGRAVSLTNVTQERQTLYLVLFSLPKIVIRADIIEFLPEDAGMQK